MLALLLYQSFCAERYVSCVVNKNTGKLDFSTEKSTVYDAYAIYDGDINNTGWYKMHVVGNESSNTNNMMRCAGAVEGYISWFDINNHFNLVCDIKGFKRYAVDDEDRYSPAWRNYLRKNYRYMNQSIRAYPESNYWKTAGYIFTQFNGLVEGYAAAAPPEARMSLLDHWTLQSQGDLGDSSHVIDKYASGPSGPTKIANEDLTPSDPESLGDHCTGLIKITDDYSDIFIAHDAWSDYRDLHGSLKEYSLPCPEFKAKKITLSTRPGKLSSYDDFYLADNGLMVIETTMTVLNQSLYDYVTPTNIFTWFRAIHTMWTTDNGHDWTTNFIKHNSGTYNNQYLIVDTKKFQRYQKPDKDLLWVIEQYPGPYYKSADITAEFIQKGYFPSINKPHFKELFEVAGYPQKISSSGPIGNFYEYEGSARYLLIEREAPRLKTFELFKEFMRYNNWRRDLYSNGDSSQQIMSRYDQRRIGDPYGVAKAFGGLDTKAARLTEAVTRLNFHAIASPSHDHGNPVWVFNETFIENYDGLPKYWNFSWIQFNSIDYDICKNVSENDCYKSKLCGWCISSQSCMPGDKAGPFFSAECEAGWTVKEELPKWAAPLILTVCIIVVLFVSAVYILHFLRKPELP